jgi:hypothetical protein
VGSSAFSTSATGAVRQRSSAEPGDLTCVPKVVAVTGLPHESNRGEAAVIGPAPGRGLPRHRPGRTCSRARRQSPFARNLAIEDEADDFLAGAAALLGRVRNVGLAGSGHLQGLGAVEQPVQERVEVVPSGAERRASAFRTQVSYRAMSEKLPSADIPPATDNPTSDPRGGASRPTQEVQGRAVELALTYIGGFDWESCQL